MKNQLVLFFLLTSLSSFAQYTQLGDKLVGTGAVGSANQGCSVSLSADGKTALVGGNQDDSNYGAVWIYTFDGNNFVQVGNKLVGTGAVGTTVSQGNSVSLSSDGKTALVGGHADNNGQGAVWVYTFNGSNYVQLGNKLVGTGAVGASIFQGCSVSLSADGATALVGGNQDNSVQGAVWIYTFNGTDFVQAGNKLVGTGASGTASQGGSVSLSADGKTAIVGGFRDATGQGAVWIYTFNGSNYVQFGSKLVGMGAVGTAGQGYSVSLSSDGKIACVGAPYDNSVQGAAWIFTFNGSNYEQAGNKLVGQGSIGNMVYQGSSVSLSADGKTVLVGGVLDNSQQGAVWVYTFNGSNYVQVGNKLLGTNASSYSNQGSGVMLSADRQVALIGGFSDNGSQGAAWVYTFNGIINFNPMITFSGATLTVGGPSLDLSSLFTTESTGIISYSINGTSASLSGTNLIPISSGQVTITGYVTSTPGFTAYSRSAIFTIESIHSENAINPQITFSGATLTVGGPSLDVSTLFATNSSGTVSYSIAGTAASLSGTTLVPISPGQVTITVYITSVSGFNAGSQSAIFTVLPRSVTGISIQELNSTITLYPNPTNGILIIEGDFDTVKITNIIGLVVYSGNQPLLDLSSLNDGLYFVRITRGSNSVIKKIIKKSD